MKRRKEKSPYDAVNAEKRWPTIYGRVNNFRKSHIMSLVNERASFLNMNEINDISFFERLTSIIVVL
jgi:hypothetical protein